MPGIEEIIGELRKNGHQGKESDFEKIFKYFLSSDGIRGKTKITQNQRNMIHLYDLMHKKRPTWGLNDAAENLAVLFISEEGRSRTQGIDLFRGLLSQMRDESITMETNTNKTNEMTSNKK